MLGLSSTQFNPAGTIQRGDQTNVRQLETENGAGTQSSLAGEPALASIEHLSEDNIQQNPLESLLQKRLHALQSIEAAGIGASPRVSLIRGISISSSTSARWVVVFFTFRQRKTTYLRRVYCFFESDEE